MKRFKNKAWLAMITIIAVLATLVPSSLAQTSVPQTLSDDEAIVLLQAYGIVKGDENGNLNLDANITRAQAAAIFVRAMGQSNLAVYLKDTREFNDTVGHWANGEIVMAKRLGLMKGDGNTFRPDDNITYAELMTVMLRMVGREPAGAWNPATIMTTAGSLGIAPASIDVTLLAGVPAQRGKVFKSLALTMVTVPLSTGETLMAKHLDNTPPELVVDSVPARASGETITISGQATGAWKVRVNGQDATLSGTRFTGTARLSGGVNTVKVEALDYAGNKTSKTVQVSLGGDPVRIEVTGATQVATNSTISVRATAYDSNGFALPASSVTAQVQGGIGTYDTASGQFRAGTQGGKGSIKFTAGTVTQTHEVIVTGLAADAHSLRFKTINNGQAVTVNRSATVVVEVLDSQGNPIPYDTGRRITLNASPSGLNISATSVNTSAGTATFTVTPTKGEVFQLMATASGLTSTAGELIAGTSTRIVLTASPNSIAANGSSASQIRAVLQDESGNAVVNNTTSDIAITLTRSGAAGSLTNSFILIPRGTSSSANYDGQFIAAFEAGTATISGRVNSSHNYTVQPVSISMTRPVVGSPSRLEVFGVGGTKLPGEEVTLTVRVTDNNGNMIPTGSYAFQIQVTSSNTQDTVTNGLPVDASLTMAGGLSPVYNGGTTAVVGRTVEGVATLKLRYLKSGKLTIKTVGVSATQNAYDSNGNPDAASSTSGWQSVEREILFDDLVGKTKGIELVWDLPSLRIEGQEVGILAANGSSTAKLKAYLIDQYGGRRPTGDGQMTITRTAGTGSRASSATATVSGGAAEFTIIAGTTADLDTYKVTYSTFEESTTLQTRTARYNDKPQIWSLFGESGNPYRIEISDKFMELTISPVPGEYGVVKVFSVTSGRLLYTSNVMNLSSQTSLRVPKELLPNGADRYKISVHTGHSDSVVSDPYPINPADAIVNARPVKIDITAVRYDAKEERLTVSASGVSTSGGGTINSDKLVLRKSGEVSVPLNGTTCTPVSSGFTCDLKGFGLLASTHNGPWLLDAMDGWFTRTQTGESAAFDEKPENNYVTPFAYVTEAALDVAAGTLTLYGVNLNQGTIYLNKLRFNDDVNLALGTTNAYVRPSNPSEHTITLPTAIAQAVRELTGTITLAGDRGWLRDSYNNENAALDLPRPVLAKADVRRAQYVASTNTLTIFGTGLEGGTVDLTKIWIHNRANNLVLRLSADDVIQNLDVNNKLNSDYVEIKLSDAHASTLESGTNDANVFVTSDPTDATGGTSWFKDAKDRLGTAIRQTTYLLNW